MAYGAYGAYRAFSGVCGVGGGDRGVVGGDRGVVSRGLGVYFRDRRRRWCTIYLEFKGFTFHTARLSIVVPHTLGLFALVASNAQDAMLRRFIPRGVLIDKTLLSDWIVRTSAFAHACVVVGCEIDPANISIHGATESNAVGGVILTTEHLRRITVTSFEFVKPG